MESDTEFPTPHNIARQLFVPAFDENEGESSRFLDPPRTPVSHAPPAPHHFEDDERFIAVPLSAITETDEDAAWQEDSVRGFFSLCPNIQSDVSLFLREHRLEATLAKIEQRLKPCDERDFVQKESRKYRKLLEKVLEGVWDCRRRWSERERERDVLHGQREREAEIARVVETLRGRTSEILSAMLQSLLSALQRQEKNYIENMQQRMELLVLKSNPLDDNSKVNISQTEKDLHGEREKQVFRPSEAVQAVLGDFSFVVFENAHRTLRMIQELLHCVSLFRQFIRFDPTEKTHGDSRHGVRESDREVETAHSLFSSARIDVSPISPFYLPSRKTHTTRETDGESLRERDKEGELLAELFVRITTTCRIVALALSLNTSKNIFLSNHLLHEARYQLLSVFYTLSLSIPSPSPSRRDERNYEALLQLYEGQEMGNSLLYASYVMYTAQKRGELSVLNIWSKFHGALEQCAQLLWERDPETAQRLCDGVVHAYNQAIVHYEFAQILHDKREKEKERFLSSTHSLSVDYYHSHRANSQRRQDEAEEDFPIGGYEETETAFRRCAATLEEHADALQREDLVAAKVCLLLSETLRSAGRSFLHAHDALRKSRREEQRVIIQSAKLFLQKAQCIAMGHDWKDYSESYFLGKAALSLVSAYKCFREAREYRESATPMNRNKEEDSEKLDVIRVLLKAAVAFEMRSSALLEGRHTEAKHFKLAAMYLGGYDANGNKAKSTTDTLRCGSAAEAYQRYWDILLHSINLDPPDEILNEEDLNKTTSFLRIDRFNNNHFDPGLQELRLKIWKHFGYLLEKCGNGYIVQDLYSVERHETILRVFCGTRGHEAVLHCLQHCLSTANQPLPFLARVHEGWRALVEHSVNTLEIALEHDKAMQKEQGNKESSVALTALLSDTASLLFAGGDEYGNVRCLLTGLEEEVMEYATFASGHHGSRRMAKSFQDMKEVVDLTLSLTRDMIDYSGQVFSSLINPHKEPPHNSPSSSSLQRLQYRIEAEKRLLFACKRVQSIRREIAPFDSISSPQDSSPEIVDFEGQLMRDWLDCWVSAKRASEQEISSIKLNHKEYARRFHDLAILFGGTHQQHRCGAGLMFDRYFQEIATVQEANSKMSPSHQPMTRHALQTLINEALECRKMAKEQEKKIKAEIERSFLKR